MDKLKKLAKELSVFGLVLAIVICLLVYKQINIKDYYTISSDKVASMVESKKDFILVIGTEKASETSTDSSNESDPATLTADQAAYVKQYIKDTRQKVYYLSIDSMENYSSFLYETFNLADNTSVPQTLFIKDGEVIINKVGTMKYVEFSNEVKTWKDAK